MNGDLVSQTDFWVVTGTASPVIALAAVVAARDALLLWPTLTEKYKDLPPSVRRILKRMAFTSYMTSVLNVMAQALVLLSSLSYLSTGKSLLGMAPVTDIEFIGIIALAVGAFSAMIASNPPPRLLRREDPDYLTPEEVRRRRRHGTSASGEQSMPHG